MASPEEIELREAAYRAARECPWCGSTAGADGPFPCGYAPYMDDDDAWGEPLPPRPAQE